VVAAIPSPSSPPMRSAARAAATASSTSDDPAPDRRRRRCWQAACTPNAATTAATGRARVCCRCRSRPQLAGRARQLGDRGCRRETPRPALPPRCPGLAETAHPAHRRSRRRRRHRPPRRPPRPATGPPRHRRALSSRRPHETELTPARREAVAALLAPQPGAGHPWPNPLPSTRWGRPGPPTIFTPVAPGVVVELTVDTAVEHHRWRHPAHFIRTRPRPAPRRPHPAARGNAAAAAGHGTGWIATRPATGQNTTVRRPGVVPRRGRRGVTRPSPVGVEPTGREVEGEGEIRGDRVARIAVEELPPPVVNARRRAGPRRARRQPASTPGEWRGVVPRSAPGTSIPSGITTAASLCATPAVHGTGYMRRHYMSRRGSTRTCGELLAAKCSWCCAASFSAVLSMICGGRPLCRHPRQSVRQIVAPSTSTAATPRPESAWPHDSQRKPVGQRVVSCISVPTPCSSPSATGTRTTVHIRSNILNISVIRINTVVGVGDPHVRCRVWVTRR
jgi:hypothetical protein